MSQQFNYSGDLQRDLQSYEHDADILDTTIQSLESMTMTQDLMTDGQPGLDPTAYKLATQSMECFLRMSRIGAPAGKIVPSIESFDGKHKISQATLESVGTGIKNVFMSIINAIKAAFSWMWGLIKRLFGRGKDREDKIADMKNQAEEIKEKARELTPEQEKEAPSTRSSEGWFKEVVISNPNILSRIVTQHGMMDRAYLDKITAELARVFDTQGKHNAKAVQATNGATASKDEYASPFAQSNDSAILKALNAPNGSKVYASVEFGGGTHVVMAIPPKPEAGPDRDSAKALSRWCDALLLTKVTTGKTQDVKRFAKLEGDLADADMLIETVSYLSKLIGKYTADLSKFQKDKEHFLKNFEDQIKKEGVNLFSTTEKKALRDNMMANLKFFKKTMDQPALAYFALCDGIVDAYEHLCTYVLHYNRTNGNQVHLKSAGH